MYQKCIENYPNNWDKACLQQKRALTKCSDDNVGILKYVKQQCIKPIEAYDQCLTANPDEPERCIQALKDLHACTEATANAYREQQKTSAEEVKSDS
ncbi:hypothetical protein DM01DRAFT_257728 [Hesseltinella vesiculosa]|uniref:IMS import disulfide relay-system CHCH-CHCH-like Cx9C domain-containing protein n=1 Tax=Hesseltinella vesiculosa TaxID=101127 RepID=A0A1X2G5P7_9FUNG|nr:hypothetical protein DM01DRAFT_257728 [Hesseltinella vesiculosa]